MTATTNELLFAAAALPKSHCNCAPSSMASFGSTVELDDFTIISLVSVYALNQMSNLVEEQSHRSNRTRLM